MKDTQKEIYYYIIIIQSRWKQYNQKVINRTSYIHIGTTSGSDQAKKFRLEHDIMITSKGMKWIWGAENIIQNCVRAIEYANAVQDLSAEQWKFTRNCYIESAIINWWKIFGSCQESTNYTRFFGENKKLCTIAISNLASTDVLSRLINSVGVSEDDYNHFHIVVKKARNKFFAHYDLTKTVEVPDIEKMKLVCLEMRNILKEVVQGEDLDVSCDNEKIRMHTSISHMRNNDDLVSGFANGIKNFGRPSSQRKVSH